MKKINETLMFKTKREAHLTLTLMFKTKREARLNVNV